MEETSVLEATDDMIRRTPMDIPDSHSNCPVGHSTALLGDRWSMLIVREALSGTDRYQGFKDQLAISDHTLTRRLAHLQKIEVLQRDDDDAARYVLTEAGHDLARVLAVLGDWAMRWLPVETPVRVPPRPVREAAGRLGITPRTKLMQSEDVATT